MDIGISDAELTLFLKENIGVERISEYEMFDDMRKLLYANGFITDDANLDIKARINNAAYVEAKKEHDKKFQGVRIAEKSRHKDV